VRRPRRLQGQASEGEEDSRTWQRRSGEGEEDTVTWQRRIEIVFCFLTRDRNFCYNKELATQDRKLTAILARYMKFYIRNLFFFFILFHTLSHLWLYIIFYCKFASGIFSCFLFQFSPFHLRWLRWFQKLKRPKKCRTIWWSYFCFFSCRRCIQGLIKAIKLLCHK